MSNFFLILITIICWGVGSIFYKIANDHIHPLMVSAFVTALYVIVLPIGIYVFKANTTVNFTGASNALIGAMFMCIGTLTYFFALQKGGAGEITSLTAVYPAITLILSAILLKEDFGWFKIIGCVFALTGVYLLSLK